MSDIALNNSKKVPDFSSAVIEGEDTLPGQHAQQKKDAYLTLFESSIIRHDETVPEAPHILYVNTGEEAYSLLTRGSFSLFQGKQKSKKTTVLALIVAALLRKDENNPGFVRKQAGKIIYFDTEQGRYYASRTLNLILRLADLPQAENLIYVDLRHYTPSERLRIIEAGIYQTKGILFVVIDGLVDIMNDFMSAHEAHSIMTNILKWSSELNLHVAGVLHQNKGDRNARAHIGTIAAQKAEIEISIDVDADNADMSIVSCGHSRGLPFEKFGVIWEKGALPKLVSIPTKVSHKSKPSSTDKKYKEAILSLSLQVKGIRTLTEMEKWLTENKGMSASTAERVRKFAVKEKLILKNENGEFYFNTEGVK